MNPYKLTWAIRGAMALALAAGIAIMAALPSAPSKAQQTGQITCSQTMQYDASTNGSTRIFTANANSSARVLFCDIFINVGAVATNVQIRAGTGTNCGTNTVNITPLFVLPVAGQVYLGGGIFQGLQTVPTRDVCIFTSAGNPVQAIINYTYQN